MPLLEVKDLKLYYIAEKGVLRAVDGVSLTVDKGEALGIVGESGCGKTSLALAMMRLLPSNTHTYGGHLSLGDMDLMELSEEEFRRRIRWREISMVFQGAMNSLNPVVKIGYQVAEPLLLDSGVDREEAYQRAIHLLEMVGLSGEIFHRYPHQLSGGMKQRVIIAMSLILRPRLVIMDEPTSALDVSVQAQIMNLLKGLKREMDLSMIFITHDIALSSDICDRHAVMYGGEIVEVGSAEEVIGKPCHPYTQLLLASTPRLHGDVKPTFIPGTPPDLVKIPRGCRFHPRCPKAFHPCGRERPSMYPAPGPGHWVRCFLYRE